MHQSNTKTKMSITDMPESHVLPFGSAQERFLKVGITGIDYQSQVTAVDNFS